MHSKLASLQSLAARWRLARTAASVQCSTAAGIPRVARYDNMPVVVIRQSQRRQSLSSEKSIISLNAQENVVGAML